MRNSTIGLTGTKAAMAPRSFSIGKRGAGRGLRSINLRRSNSWNKMVSGAPNDATLERSLSFKNWEPLVAEPEAAAAAERKEDHPASDDVTLQPPSLKIPANFVAPQLKLPRDLLLFASPRPLSELDAAAIKLQKVYKSYRTRRNLVDLCGRGRRALVHHLA